MNRHSYRLLVEEIDPETGEAVGGAVTVNFDSHDQIFDIVKRLSSRPELDANGAAALTIGLKILGWLTLRHKKDPLYAALLANVGTFIKSLKA